MQHDHTNGINGHIEHSNNLREVSPASTLVSPNSTSTSTTRDGHPSKINDSTTATTSSYLASLQLPQEALLLIFQILHEQNYLLIHPCMQVCKTWYNLITQESKFWHRLSLNLDYLDSAAHRAVTYANRCSRKVAAVSPRRRSSPPVAPDLSDPAAAVNGTQNPVQPEWQPTSFLDIFIAFTDRANYFEQAGSVIFDKAYISGLSAIMKAMTLHLYDLRTFKLVLAGDFDSHVNILRKLMLPMVVPLPTSFTIDAHTPPLEILPKVFQVKQFELILQHIRGIPLSQNCLAWFAHSEVLYLHGQVPFPPSAGDEPQMPRVPSQLLQFEEFRKRGIKPDAATSKNILKIQRDYERKWKKYEQARYTKEIFDRQDQLDWSWFHEPAIITSPITRQLLNTQICQFQQLSRLTLHGCAIADDLVLPELGFPKLQNLIVVHCQWGRGFWNFLRATPHLEVLTVEYMQWHPDSDWTDELDPLVMPSELGLGSQKTCGGNLVASQETEPDMDDDEETPPFVRPASPTLSEPDLSSNYIIQNSVIITLGDADHPIEDFEDDDDGVEGDSPDSLYNDFLSRRLEWSASEAVYDYPPEICYPPTIEDGIAWHVVSKPIWYQSWKYAVGLRYAHRVWTHSDDEKHIEEDFDSEYSWAELQRRREEVRRNEDLHEGLNGKSDSERKAKAATRVRNLRNRKPAPDIVLDRLHTFSQVGGTYEHIWANVKDLDPGVTSSSHASVHMPSVRHISLRGDESFFYSRLSRPVAAFQSTALGYVDNLAATRGEEIEITHWDYDAELNKFDDGEAVTNEISDEKLVGLMSDDEFAHHLKHPQDLWKYRHKWRVSQDLQEENGMRYDRAILELIVGASRLAPLPCSLSALVATCPHLTQLDLSFTYISSEIFAAAMGHATQLRILSLAGVSSLSSYDLEILPRTCTMLHTLNISRTSAFSCKGAAYVVDQMKQNSFSVSRLSRLYIDDPNFFVWPDGYATFGRSECNFFRYLEFLGLVVDEEAEFWMECLRTGSRFNKKIGKQPKRYKDFVPVLMTD